MSETNTNKQRVLFGIQKELTVKHLILQVRKVCENKVGHTTTFLKEKMIKNVSSQRPHGMKRLEMVFLLFETRLKGS